MIKVKYRLEDYIITGYDESFFTWEMNMVLGEHRVGNCFIIGDILVFESWNQKKDGFLKMGFHSQLKKLPIWNKTRYYCFSSNLRDVETRQPLSNHFNKMKLIESHIDKGSVGIIEPGIFRLGRYEIIVDTNGKIKWQIYDRVNNVKSGSCITESGILFLKTKEFDLNESQSKKAWFKDLMNLPQWDKTFAWGQHNLLRSCQQSISLNSPNVIPWKTNRSNNDKVNSTPFSETQNRKKQEPQRDLSSDFWLKMFSSYKSIRWGHWLSLLFSLLKNGVFIGFHIFLSILTKVVHLFGKTRDCISKIVKKKGRPL